ncbi:MAG: proline dehydrogenase family protein [Candidatus Eremiobacteraeota bacterium]|nr:proline dehydrogenase family protein [Candidatus Eremiobacteraeota bacterium]
MAHGSRPARYPPTLVSKRAPQHAAALQAGTRATRPRRAAVVAVFDIVRSPGFQQRFFILAKRFVAGETADDAIRTIARLNAEGMTATVDFLGEDVTTREEAERTRDAYFAVLEAIRASGVRSNVSVKLTAMGLLIDEDFALRNVLAVLEAAARNDDPFVRIDMEGSVVTDATLRVFERAYAQTSRVGPALQAYLKRTEADVERAIGLGARVRLCKGAYAEAPEIAYQDMPTIRRCYVRDAEALLERGAYPAIATHDERIVAAVQTFVRERGIARDRFEFQLLFGVRPDLQRRLVAEGWRVRIYVPYGTHWAGYFYRRITERPENALFALRSVVGR